MSRKSKDEIREVLADCSLRLKHILLVIRTATPGNPYIARNCRVKIAKQLAAKELITIEPEGRLDWLRCVPTPDGELAIAVLVEQLRVKVHQRALSERMGQ